MDFRFKYRRHPPSERQRKREARQSADSARRMRGAAIGLSIPMSLVAGPLAGWLIGSWLDRQLGTGYWLTVLVLAFTAASLFMVIELLLKLGRE